jgi:hypothetical protein
MAYFDRLNTHSKIKYMVNLTSPILNIYSRTVEATVSVVEVVHFDKLRNAVYRPFLCEWRVKQFVPKSALVPDMNLKMITGKHYMRQRCVIDKLR